MPNERNTKLLLTAIFVLPLVIGFLGGLVVGLQF